MEVVTQNGNFSLTKTKNDGILSIKEVSQRFIDKIGERDYITFKEWEEVLDGSDYAISFISS